MLSVLARVFMHVHYNFYARSQGNQQYTRMASTKRLWRMSEAVSEKANELSENIDLSSPEEIACVMGQIDTQIFTGWKHHKGVCHPATISMVTRIAESACEVLQDGSGCGHIVLSGCGTSGRLAFVVARTFNAHLSSLSRPALFHYVVAGGDPALLKSEEAVEDSWEAGSQDLAKITAEMTSVLFVGISCGLSAPYVAGQLSHCLEHSHRFTPVLLGFNPTSAARRTPIRDSSKTFYDVVCEMEGRGHMILTPIVGPEAITGSTRLKGGTATKMLLEVTFALALEKLQWKEFRSSPLRLLQAYQLTCLHTYTSPPTDEAGPPTDEADSPTDEAGPPTNEASPPTDEAGPPTDEAGPPTDEASPPTDVASSVARAIEITGKCLQSGGHVYYLGMGTPGVMAIIDASECPPTFGVEYGTVRGFIAGGYTTLRNTAGSLTARHTDYELDISYFTASLLPHLSHDDCVVVVVDPTVALETGLPWTPPVRSDVSSHTYQTMAVVVTTDDMAQIDTSAFDHAVVVRLPWKPLSWYWSHDISRDLLLEAGVKWVLNAISTGAHIISGKVLGNRMIDLKVSNSKLYNRAIGIVQTFSGVDTSTATNCLLTAIYGEDYSTGSHTGGDISPHITRATAMDKVVPVALLLSMGLYSVSSAREALRGTPIIRHVLAQHRGSNEPYMHHEMRL